MAKATDVTQLLSLNETRLRTQLEALNPDEVRDTSFALQVHADAVVILRAVVAEVLETKQLHFEQRAYVEGLSDEQKTALIQSLGLAGVPPRK
jgi:hypothetical protein